MMDVKDDMRRTEHDDCRLGPPPGTMNTANATSLDWRPQLLNNIEKLLRLHLPTDLLCRRTTLSGARRTWHDIRDNL